MSEGHDQDFRERLRALVREYARRKARSRQVAPPANDDAADAKVIPFRVRRDCRRIDSN